MSRGDITSRPHDDPHGDECDGRVIETGDMRFGTIRHGHCLTCEEQVTWDV